MTTKRRTEPTVLPGPAADLDARVAAAIEKLLENISDDEFDFRLLGPMAKVAGVAERDLRAWAEEGRFAPVYVISQRTAFVRASELRAWMARAELSPRRAPDPRDLDVSPAEPFSNVSGRKSAARRGKTGRAAGAGLHAGEQGGARW